MMAMFRPVSWTMCNEDMTQVGSCGISSWPLLFFSVQRSRVGVITSYCLQTCLFRGYLTLRKSSAIQQRRELPGVARQTCC